LIFFCANNSIKDALPEHLTHLIFGHMFNQSIINALPNRLLHLTFGHVFDQPINDQLPCDLQKLSISAKYAYINNIPKNIKINYT